MHLINVAHTLYYSADLHLIDIARNKVTIRPVAGNNILFGVCVGFLSTLRWKNSRDDF